MCCLRGSPRRLYDMSGTLVERAESMGSAGTLPEPYTWCFQHQSLRLVGHLPWSWTSISIKPGGSCVGFPDLASEALPLQQSTGCKWVIRPFQIQGERNRLPFLMEGHILGELRKYFRCHLWKMQSSTFTSVSHLLLNCLWIPDTGLYLLRSQASSLSCFPSPYLRCPLQRNFPKTT